MAVVRIFTYRITDWASFHLECKEVFGFPEFYGMNLNAWIDCLTYLDEGDGMSKFHLDEQEKLIVEVIDSTDFKSRLPEVFEGFVESTNFVNQRYVDDGKLPKVILALS